jgi:nicotinamidase-related amidase
MLNTEWLNLHPALEARPDEPVVAKPRISAFEGTDLKVLLRSKDIDTLVLFGIITSGVVLSTALEAMDQGYLRDGRDNPLWTAFSLNCSISVPH